MAVSKMHVAEIAELLGATVVGDPQREIVGIAPIEQATANQIGFIGNPKYISLLRTTTASAILVTPQVAEQGAPEGVSLVVLDDPYMGFAKLLRHWTEEPRQVTGVSERAFVDSSAQLGQDVNVMPLAYVGPGAVIGDRVDLHPGSHVGANTQIGADSILGPNAVVHHRCQIGARCYIYGGAVIGSDGFGFAPNRQTGLHVKIPQTGIVVIEDDVEIGANSTIDRAVLGETRVGRGTKIDNQVQIGHNSTLGMGCFLVSQVGVSGSAKVGNFVTVAGQAGIAGHITVGDGSIIGAQAGVHSDVGPGDKMLGSPAVPGGEAKRAMAVIPQLPAFKKRLRKLERRLDELQADAQNTSSS